MLQIMHICTIMNDFMHFQVLFSSFITHQIGLFYLAPQDGIHCDAFLLYIVYHIFVDECGSA